MPSKAESVPLHPQILWAQREKVLYLTIDVEDLKFDDFSITENKLHLKGVGGHEKTKYECTLEFFGTVDGANYRRIPTDRRVELVIPKTVTDGKGQWWPRLLKASGRVAWIKVDFNKWKDEDDMSDKGEEDQYDLNNMMEKLGGAGGGGLPPDLGDFEDSDNEDLPDLEDDVPEDKEEEKDEKESKIESEVKSGVRSVDDISSETTGTDVN